MEAIQLQLEDAIMEMTRHMQLETASTVDGCHRNICTLRHLGRLARRVNILQRDMCVFMEASLLVKKYEPADKEEKCEETLKEWNKVPKGEVY